MKLHVTELTGLTLRNGIAGLSTGAFQANMWCVRIHIVN
jgi:hypothetical protein